MDRDREHENELNAVRHEMESLRALNTTAAPSVDLGAAKEDDPELVMKSQLMFITDELNALDKLQEAKDLKAQLVTLRKQFKEREHS